MKTTESTEQLMERYFRGETSLEEEQLISRLLNEETGLREEQDMFAYFANEAQVPDNLEETLFAGIQQHEQKRRNLGGRRIAMWSAVAAVLVLFFSVFSLQKTENSGLSLSEEAQFALLEQALGQVSYSLQPSEDDDLVVVFQDKNIEMIME